MYYRPTSFIKHLKWIALIITCLISVPTFSQRYVGVHIGGLSLTSFEDRNVSSYNHFNVDNSSTFYSGVSYRDTKKQGMNLTYQLDYQLIKASSISYSRGDCDFGCTNTKNNDIKVHSLIFRALPEFKRKGKFTIYWNLGPYIGLATKADEQAVVTVEYEEFSMDPVDGSTIREIKERKYEYSGKLKDIGIWELGGSTSLGMEVPLSNKSALNLALSYSIGIIQNDRREYDKKFLKDEFKIDDFWISLGLQKQLFKQTD